LNQVAEGLARLLGIKIEIEFSKVTGPDVSDMVADIRKVSEEFNWKPTIDMKKGIAVNCSRIR
jgi:nucleoside-diphosphate-sugar epimerase